MKQVFVGSVALAICAQLVLLLMQHSLWGISVALLVFFTAFNVLEATLPSMISKVASLAAKGTAMGVYSSVQFLGAFFGASVGGALMQFVGGDAVFYFAIAMLCVWLVVASSMRPLALVRTKMYHLEQMGVQEAAALQQQLARLQGVREALVAAGEGMACLKVEMQGFDEEAVQRLVTQAGASSK
jgi:MFS family permease